MARCGCTQGLCSCAVVGGDSDTVTTVVTGNGSQESPYTVTSEVTALSGSGLLLESGPKSKLTALAALAALTGDEIIYIVEDVDGTPVSMKMTVGDFLAAVAASAELVDTYIAKALLDANTVVIATVDDTPVALPMGPSTILARLAAGDIVAATPSQLRTLLSLVVGTDVQAFDDDLLALATAFIRATSAGPASLDFAEDTDNGTNRARVTAPASIATDRTLTLPTHVDGTLALTSDPVLAQYAKPTGALYETYPRWLGGNNSSILTSGTLRMGAISLPAGLTVTSISIMAGATSLAGGTHAWAALFDSSRALLRQSTDDTSPTWAGNTLKTFTLSTPYVTTYSGLHYIGLLLTGSTMPTISTYSSPTAILYGLAPVVCGPSDAGLTGTAPNPAAAITAAVGHLYAYVS